MCNSVLQEHIVTKHIGTITVIDQSIRAKGERHTKTQGTCKTGERCTAHIKDLSSGEVHVQYCSTHHNHDIGHVRIQHDTRMKIAAQLHQGVTMTRIMDNIRENTEGGITREHLVIFTT